METGLGNEDLITVVVPAYNVGAYIERCVMSLLVQTHRNLEVIVVNDRSTDDTPLVLDRLANQDPRLRVIHVAENGGPHIARAQGVACARGAYIGFVDGDDRVEPLMYATMLREAQQENADIVQCGIVLEDEHGNYLSHKVLIPERQVLEDDLLGRFSRLEFGSGSLCNKLFRREVIAGPAALDLGGPVYSGEDQIVCFACFALAQRIVLLPNDLYRYFVRSGSTTNSTDSTNGFVQLLGSYIRCLKVFASSNEEMLASVDVLYARQFRYVSYRVSDTRLLEPYHGSLRTALADLGSIRPQAIYSLVHSFDTTDEPSPVLPLRYRLGQLRIAMRLLAKAVIRGRS